MIDERTLRELGQEKKKFDEIADFSSSQISKVEDLLEHFNLPIPVLGKTSISVIINGQEAILYLAWAPNPQGKRYRVMGYLNLSRDADICSPDIREKCLMAKPLDEYKVAVRCTAVRILERFCTRCSEERKAKRLELEKIVHELPEVLEDFEDHAF